MMNYKNVKRIFVVSVMLLAMLVCNNAAIAAVTISGDVTPANIDTVPNQPGANLIIGDAGVAGFGDMFIDNGSDVVVNDVSIGTVQNGTFAIQDSGSSLTANGNFLLSGATAGNSVSIDSGSTITVLGSMTIGGGPNDVTFTATNSGTISVGGDLTVGDKGAFSATSAIGDIDVTGDLNLSGANSNVYIQQSVNVGGDMNVTGGNSSSYQIAGSTTDVNVTGDIVVDSSSVLSIQNGSPVTAGGFVVEDQGSGTGAVLIGTGTAQQGAVVVGSDGVLLNSGTVEGQLLVDGELGREGDAPDTMTVADGNNFNLQTGSTFIVNIDKTAAPTNDNVVVTTGDAVLASGSTIRIVPVDASQLNNGDTFDVVTASAGTVTDNGVILDQPTPTLFRYFTGSVVGGDTYQLLYTENSFASQAHGKNNVSVANALDNMLDSGNATPAQETMLDNLLTLDQSAYNSALHQMNAEMYTLHGRNLPNQMESFNRFLGQHLTQMRNSQGSQVAAVPSLGMALASTEVDPETMAEVIESKKEQDERGDALTDTDSSRNAGWSVWGQIINMWHKEKSSSRLTGYNNSSWGAVAGTDKEFAPGLRIGALMGYIRSEYHMKDYRGKLDVDTLRVGPYVDWSRGKMFVEAALTFGYHWNDAERRVNYQGFSDEDKANNYGAWDLSPYARVGYKFNVGGWDLTPSMAMQYVHYSQDGTTEHGGAAAMKINDYETNSLRQIFLVELSKLFDLNYVKLVPAFSAGYSYDYLNTGETLDSSFIGGYPCTFYPGGTSKGHVIWGASLTALLSDNLSLFVRYDGFASGTDYSNSLSSGVNYKF